ncbi:MAG: hypothetical protein JSS20_11910 [Proteobacteria bacterium]|nr:hypothetical protein [Pseudomonadota bacterium]
MIEKTPRDKNVPEREPKPKTQAERDREQLSEQFKSNLEKVKNALRTIRTKRRR